MDTDFLAFDDINESAFSNGNNEKSAKPGKLGDSGKDLEARMNKRFDKARYPWLSKRTMKIKDIFLFLHSEILDFVEFIKQTEEDKTIREEVVDRIKKVVHKVYP